MILISITVINYVILACNGFFRNPARNFAGFWGSKSSEISRWISRWISGFEPICTTTWMAILLQHLYHYIVIENPASKSGSCPKSRNPASQNPASQNFTNLAAGFWCWIPYRYRNQNHYPATQNSSLSTYRYTRTVQVLVVYRYWQCGHWLG